MGPSSAVERTWVPPQALRSRPSISIMRSTPVRELGLRRAFARVASSKPTRTGRACLTNCAARFSTCSTWLSLNSSVSRSIVERSGPRWKLTVLNPHSPRTRLKEGAARYAAACDRSGAANRWSTEPGRRRWARPVRGDLLTLVDYAGNRHPTAESQVVRLPSGCRVECRAVQVNDRSILFASYDVRIEIRQIAVGVIKPLCAHEVSLVVIHLHRGSSQRDRCAPRDIHQVKYHAVGYPRAGCGRPWSVGSCKQWPIG